MCHVIVDIGHVTIQRQYSNLTPAMPPCAQVRFLVMANMFQTELLIHRKYDIKGSTSGRTVGNRADDNDPSIVYKDLDLDFKIQLEPAWYARLMTQLERDANFLKSIGVMDYSLLLGIHSSAKAGYKVRSTLHP